MNLNDLADAVEGLSNGESCAAECPHRLSGTTEACDAAVCAVGVLLDAANALRDLADGYSYVVKG